MLDIEMILTGLKHSGYQRTSMLTRNVAIDYPSSTRMQHDRQNLLEAALPFRLRGARPVRALSTVNTARRCNKLAGVRRRKDKASAKTVARSCPLTSIWPPTNADENVVEARRLGHRGEPACPETLAATAQRAMLKIEATFTGSQAL
jgi:hypothetical protein